MASRPPPIDVENPAGKPESFSLCGSESLGWKFVVRVLLPWVLCVLYTSGVVLAALNQLWWVSSPFLPQVQSSPDNARATYSGRFEFEEGEWYQFRVEYSSDFEFSSDPVFIGFEDEASVMALASDEATVIPSNEAGCMTIGNGVSDISPGVHTFYLLQLPRDTVEDALVDDASCHDHDWKYSLPSADDPTLSSRRILLGSDIDSITITTIGSSLFFYNMSHPAWSTLHYLIVVLTMALLVRWVYHNKKIGNNEGALVFIILAIMFVVGFGIHELRTSLSQDGVSLGIYLFIMALYMVPICRLAWQAVKSCLKWSDSSILDITGRSPRFPRRDPRHLRVLVGDTPQTPSRMEGLEIKGPKTPYFCPVCFLYFSSVLKTDCCGQYLCESCLRQLFDESERKLISLPERLPQISCLYCATATLSVSPVLPEESIRQYEDSPASRQLAAVKRSSSRAVYSPLKIGDDFEKMKLKMTTFEEAGFKRKSSDPHIASPLSAPPSDSDNETTNTDIGLESITSNQEGMRILQGNPPPPQLPAAIESPKTPSAQQATANTG